MARLIAVGDIHGQYSKLLDLMDQIDPGKGDQFVFLGDYVDSGPQSAEVIEYLIRFRRYRDATFILGNHDSWFLDYIETGYADPGWLMYGGLETLESYGIAAPGTYRVRSDIPWDHQEFLRLASPPVRFETIAHDREYVFSHGFLCPTKPIESRFNTSDALWGRPSTFGMDLKGGKPLKKWGWGDKQYLVFGHTPHPEPKEYDGRALGIDTGAKVDSRPLTAVILAKSSAGKHTFLQSARLDVDPDKMHHDEEEDALD